MSGITFNSYPISQRTHGVFAEIDPQNTSGTQNQRTLLIGQRVAAGTAPAGIQLLGTGLSAGKAACGAGSQLAIMYDWYLRRDSFGEVWLAPLSDDPAAIAATGSITYANTTSAAGVLSTYIGGVLLSIALAAGTTPAAIATSVAAAINVQPDLPVSAIAAAGVVTLTADNKGQVGNEIDIRMNYLGTPGGEATPAGLTVTIVPMAGGATNPLTGLQALLSNLGSQAFDFIVLPYTDTASLGALATFLNQAVGRWSWTQEIYGHVFTAIRGTAGALTTFGTSQNVFTTSGMGFYDSPTPAWAWGGQPGRRLRHQPARRSRVAARRPWCSMCWHRRSPAASTAARATRCCSMGSRPSRSTPPVRWSLIGW